MKYVRFFVPESKYKNQSFIAYEETKLKMIRRYALRRYKRNKEQPFAQSSKMEKGITKNKLKKQQKPKSMKAKIFLGLTAGITAIAAATIVTVSSVNARSTQSDLMTKNIEALSQSESGGGSEIACYASIVPVEGGKVVYCGTCDNEDSYGPSKMYEPQQLGKCTKN